MSNRRKTSGSGSFVAILPKAEQSWVPPEYIACLWLAAKDLFDAIDAVDRFAIADHREVLAIGQNAFDEAMRSDGDPDGAFEEAQQKMRDYIAAKSIPEPTHSIMADTRAKIGKAGSRKAKKGQGRKKRH